MNATTRRASIERMRSEPRPPSAADSFIARTAATMALSKEVAGAVMQRVYLASDVPADVQWPCVVIGEIVLSAPDPRMTVTVFARDLDEAETIVSLVSSVFGWTSQMIGEVEYRRLEGKLTAATLTVRGAA